MSDPRPPEGEPDAFRSDEVDPGADTAMFRAFVEHGEEDRPRAGSAFRLWTLLGGLVAFVLVVLLLLRA